MTTPAILRLRPVTAALGVLREYGGTPPEALREAHALIREARHLASEAAVAPAVTYAHEVLAAEDKSKALNAAAKKRAADRDRAEIAAALSEAAVDRAVRVFAEHADEIADAILSSAALTRAFEDVEHAASEVPGSALAEPRADDLDLVARTAVLRRAVLPFERALVSLVASGLVSEFPLQGASALLFADPAEADPDDVRRACKGLRPGVPDVNVYTASAVLAPAARPFAPNGVPAAILAATPGVVFRQATTVEEFERRVRRTLAAPDAPMTFAEDDGRRAGLVL